MEIATKKVKYLRAVTKKTVTNLAESHRGFFFLFALGPSLCSVRLKLSGNKTDASGLESSVTLCHAGDHDTRTSNVVRVGVAHSPFDAAVPPPLPHFCLLLLSSSLQALMLPTRPRKVLSLVCIRSCCAFDAVVYNQDTSVAGSERCHRSPRRRKRRIYFFLFLF